MKIFKTTGGLFNTRIIKKGIALFMAGAVLVSSPLGYKSEKAVKAATTKYVKEVVLSYGKTKEDAAKWLKDNGYEVVDSDLHSGTDTNSKTVNVVLMGYKTTTNPYDAITDISVMPMDGGFKTTDMESLLESQRNKVEDSVDKLIIAAKEYKLNYKKAVKNRARGKNDYIEVLKIHDILNRFEDDDTKKGMGDFFLKDFTKSKDREKLVKILVQANPDIITSIQNIMVMTSGNPNNTWIERMCKTNDKKSFFERMVARNKTKTRAKKAIEKAYGSKMDFLVSDWENLQGKMYDVKETMDELNDKFGDKKISEKEFDEFFGIDGEIKEVDEDMSDKEKTKVMNNNMELQKNIIDYNTYTEAFSVFARLSDTKMNGETLYDFVMKKRDFTEGNDRYEICAILEHLSDAQFDAYGKVIDTYTLIKYAIAGDNDILDNINKKQFKKEIKLVDKEIESTENESIYVGVNREVFKGEVAVTSLADTRDINCSYKPNIALEILAGVGIIYSLVTGVLGAIMISSTVRNILMEDLGLYGENFAHNLVSKIADKIALKESGQTMNWLLCDSLTLFRDKNENIVGQSVVDVNGDLYNRIAATANKIVLVLGIAVVVVSIVVGFFSIKRIIDENTKKLEGDYSVAIPQFMVDIYSDEDDDEDMVYYEAVRCNRNDSNMTGVKEDNAGLKDYGDLNGDSGKFWCVPYTTKDSLAGDPILADSFEVKHGKVKFDEKEEYLHSFNERGTGYNITSESYNFNDSNDGT
ncbi:MAG: hypothetical protein K6D02_10080, partial [Lachnospiraceae bacterium]|nr:hypothetical protein [Lachnospiraceae bacterium]